MWAPGSTALRSWTATAPGARRDLRLGVGAHLRRPGLGALQHGPLDLGSALRLDLARRRALGLGAVSLRPLGPRAQLLGWAPGPVVVRPVYSPALVVFLGGVTVGVARPVTGRRSAGVSPSSRGGDVRASSAPRRGAAGVARASSTTSWSGNTNVNVTNINVYRNVTVNNAVVGVSAIASDAARPRCSA